MSAPSAFDALLRPATGKRDNAPATVVFDLDGTAFEQPGGSLGADQVVEGVVERA